MNRLTYHQQFNKGFLDWQLPFYFLMPILRHLAHFIDGMSNISFTGKLTEIHALVTIKSIVHFLGVFLKTVLGMKRIFYANPKNISDKTSLQKSQCFFCWTT